MLTLPAAVVIAAGVVILVIAAIILIAIYVVRKRRRQDRARLRELALRTAPSFGMPKLVHYDPAAYISPLRCASDICGHHFLTEGEAFYEIPVENQGDRGMLSICTYCADEAALDNKFNQKTEGE